MRDRWLHALAVVWFAVIACAMVVMWRYKLVPGETITAPAEWPRVSGLEHAPDRATIVMMAHPHCPCTRASVTELADVMSSLGDHARAYVLVVRPDGVPDGWERTDTWTRAANIPGVTVVVDPNGARASTFGAHVSGDVAAYDAAGHLVFSGGITAARGHEGDNVGQERLLAAVTHPETGRASSPTFGCALFDH